MTADRPARDDPSPTPDGGVVIDAERMALLLDGRLDDRARDALLAELEASPASLEVYADALAALGDTGDLDAAATDSTGSTSGTTVTPISRAESNPRRLGPGGWLATAAIVVIMVGGTFAWQARRTTGLSSPQQMVAALSSPTRTALDTGMDSGWTRMRGAADLLSPRARGVRVGMRLAELELLATSGEPWGESRAPRVMTDIATLLDATSGGTAAGTIYRSLAASGSAPTADQLRIAAESAERIAGDDAVRVGAWLATARVATARRDAVFFRSVASRQAVTQLARLAPDAKRATLRLDAALAAVPSAWGEVEASFGELVRVLAN